MNPSPARRRLIAGVLTVVLGCAVAPPPVATPPAGAAQSPSTPPAPIDRGGDFDLGLRITLEALHEVGFVDDDSLLTWVNDVGYRVASVAPERSLFTFHIIDLPYPNAFALPGGFVFVTKGMLEMDLTEPELAALLGHEIGHVTGHHFSRSQRLSSILSLAQVALLVGVLLAGEESGSGTRYEQQGDMIYGGSTGQEALVQGVPTFGGLFRTLIERKYGRGLELEADEVGGRLAAAAGYPPTAAVGMLQRFRARIHDDTTYGYWLTHPFFKERVTRAVVQARALQSTMDPPSVFVYRRAVQRELFRKALNRENELEAAFLYQLALQAEPHGMTALEAGRKILEFRTGRQERKRPLEREIWPIIADYDSLITRARRFDPDGPLYQRMRAERDSLDRIRMDTLSDYLNELDRDLRSTTVLAKFVVNYPDHERLPEMRYYLAENYGRSSRQDQAIRVCLDIIREHPETAWAGKSLDLLVGLLRRVESPMVMQAVIDAPVPDSLRAAAAERMTSLIVSVDSMEDAAAFMEKYPDSPYAPAMRERLEAEASKAYQQAKILEGVARAQEALDAYHRILFVAPESGAATLARERIDQLVRTG